MKESGWILVQTDGSPRALDALGKLFSSVQRFDAPCLLSLPADLSPDQLPAVCRHLPDLVLPLLICIETPPPEAVRNLSAALGRPISGWHLEDWQRTPPPSLPRLYDTVPELLLGCPPLVDAALCRIGARLAISLRTDDNGPDTVITLNRRTNDLAVNTAAARMAAYTACPPLRIPAIPVGGWLQRDRIHALAAELAERIRIPTTCSLSLAEAFVVILQTVADPQDDRLWLPISPPGAMPPAEALSTTAGQIRKAAAALCQVSPFRIPSTVAVNGYAVAVPAFLHAAAKLLITPKPDKTPIAIPASPPVDDQLHRQLRRHLPIHAPTHLLNPIIWDTARLETSFQEGG